MGSVLALWNWLYDSLAIQAGFITVYNRPYAAGQEPGRIGIVAQQGTFGETMANAFMDETLQLGGEVSFMELLPSAELWFRMPEVLAGRVNDVDALYLPVTGGDAPEYAAGVLDDFGGHEREFRVLALEREHAAEAPVF